MMSLEGASNYRRDATQADFSTLEAPIAKAGKAVFVIEMKGWKGVVIGCLIPALLFERLH